MVLELDPHELERLVQQHAALARIEAGRGRLEHGGGEAHLAVGAESALGLQRQRLDAAGHGLAGIHSHALLVFDRLELGATQRGRQRDDARCGRVLARARAGE